MTSLIVNFGLIMCESIYAVWWLVCPSVRPSHGWISQKWLKLWYAFFCRTVAPSF